MVEIPFPGPNEEGVVVIRMMVIAPVGQGKTSLMRALAPEICEDPSRWRIVSPVAGETGTTILGERLGVAGTVLKGNDRKSCERYFGKIVNDRSSVLLLIDEFDEYCPGGVTGTTGGYICYDLYSLMNYGRNEPQRVALFVSARGTADVTTNAIRAMDVVFFGNMWEGNAIKYLRSSVRQGEIDFEKIVRNMPPFVFMVWAPSRGGFNGFLHVHEDGSWGSWDPETGCDSCDLKGISLEEETKTNEDDSSPESPEPPETRIPTDNTP